MNDRAVNLLEQYDIEIFRTKKGRGAILCDTDQGCLIYKQYTGSDRRIEIQNSLLTYIAKQQKVNVERMIPTKEGMLYVKDHDGVKYVLKTYCEGRECNIYEKTEYLEAVKLLARLHQSMEGMQGLEQEMFRVSQEKEYEKHNRELKKVRKYLQQKSQKTWFEIQLLHTFDLFLEQALTVAEDWHYYQHVIFQEQTEGGGQQKFCHGDYQYHNILKCEQGWMLVNFERCVPDDPIRDLYLLMRKLLEKGNWSVALGRDLLSAYEKERSIEVKSRIDLYYRLSYPEKFWKIVNFYYNSGKAWIPERNYEKLMKLLNQEEEKQNFLREIFCNFG